MRPPFGRGARQGHWVPTQWPAADLSHWDRYPLTQRILCDKYPFAQARQTVSGVRPVPATVAAGSRAAATALISSEGATPRGIQAPVAELPLLCASRGIHSSVTRLSDHAGQLSRETASGVRPVPATVAAGGNDLNMESLKLGSGARRRHSAGAPTADASSVTRAASARKMARPAAA